MDKIIEELHELADYAYIQYTNICRTDPCLGETIKLEKGWFKETELACHRRASVWLGRHQALHDAINLLRKSAAHAEVKQ